MAGVNIIQDGGTPAVVSKLKLEVATAFVLMGTIISLLMEFPFKRVHRKCEHFNGITKPSQSAQH
jgi:hypothetical protein